MRDVSRVLGPYRLDRRLGRGGMGEVWKARDRRLDRWVAIKRVRAEVSADETAHQRFRREARTVAQLSHPSIVQIFDLLEEDDGDWVVMEYVDGPTVTERVAGGPLDVGVALDYARQVAEGLAEAHEKGVVHRDLKTENVMIAPSGHVKILDFGLAKRLVKEEGEATLSVSGEVMGTGRAMSPEQAQSYEVDHRSDLFSLGVFLYETLTGTSPFRGKSLLETLNNICRHQQTPLVELRPEVPADLSRLVERLLAKHPSLRPASAREVAAELGRIARLTASVEPASEPPAAALDQQTLPGTIADPAVPLPPPASELRAVASADPSEPPAPRQPGWRRAARAALAVAAVAALAWAFSTQLRQALPGGWTAGATAAAPDSYELYQRGLALLERYDKEDHIDQAIEAFQEVLAQDEDSAPAYAGLSRGYWRKYYFSSGDRSWLEQALAAAQQAVDLDEDLAAARVSLGLAYASLGRSDEAEEELGQALLLDPTSADARRGLGDAFRSAQKLAEAEESYRLAIEARPDDPELHSILGEMLLRAGRYPEAESSFRRSIELAPDSFLGRRNLGVAHYAQGRLAEAAAEFQKALEIQPDASLYSNLGTLFFTQGLYSRALAAYQKALDMGTLSHHHLLWGNLGDAYRWIPGKEEEAKDAYLRAIQLLRDELPQDSENFLLRSRLALYLAKRGDTEEALAEIERIGSSEELGPGTLFRLAVASEICGARDKALEELAKALRAGFSQDEVRRDPELLSLRADPRYPRLVMGS